MGFGVLFVCTGNIHRSPAGEFLLRAMLVERMGVAVESTVTERVAERVAELARDIDVSSAGTSGVVGHPIHRDTAKALVGLGVDPEGHSARRLDRPTLQDADLVLTASAEHRSIILEAEPAMLAQVFTLKEFVRLGASPVGAPTRGATAPGGAVPTEPTAALRARVQSVAAQRGFAPPPVAGEDDVADPVGRSVDVVAATVDEIAAAVRAALDVLLQA